MRPEIREMFIRYQQQGLTAKEAAQMVQKATGCSAVTGQPIKKPQPKQGEYRGQYGA